MDETARGIRRNVFPKWGSRSIREIGRRDAKDLLDSVVDRGAPVAAMFLFATGASADTRGLTIKLKASEPKNVPVTQEVRLYGSSHALVIGIDALTGG